MLRRLERAWIERGSVEAEAARPRFGDDRVLDESWRRELVSRWGVPTAL